MHVEALQWLNRILTGRLRANCQQLYELGNANSVSDRTLCSCLSETVGLQETLWSELVVISGLKGEATTVLFGEVVLTKLMDRGA